MGAPYYYDHINRVDGMRSPSTVRVHDTAGIFPAVPSAKGYERIQMESARMVE